MGQLRDVRAMTGLKTYIPAVNVDVEAPEWESEAFRVLVFRKLAVQENLRVTSVKLPVHLRYHRPASPNPAQDSLAAHGNKVKKSRKQNGNVLEMFAVHVI